jgi:ActR/RegA family two-component response regulator
MPGVLETHGFKVTAVGTVAEALSEITTNHFDVLLSDLNIGHPADGFVVVSAMRRIQPQCVTLILTGFPGFETALQAIRGQVDDYLLKPTPISNLVALIEQNLKDRKAGEHQVTPMKRISEIVRGNAFEITQRALQSMKSDPQLGALLLSDEERIEDVPHLLREVAAMLESSESAAARNGGIRAASLPMENWHRQGYTVPVLIARTRLLERAIYDVIHENLLTMNLSYLMLDLKRLNESLILQLEQTVQSYQDSQRTA